MEMRVQKSLLKNDRAGCDENFKLRARLFFMRFGGAAYMKQSARATEQLWSRVSFGPGMCQA